MPAPRITCRSRLIPINCCRCCVCGCINKRTPVRVEALSFLEVQDAAGKRTAVRRYRGPSAFRWTVSWFWVRLSRLYSGSLDASRMGPRPGGRGRDDFSAARQSLSPLRLVGSLADGPVRRAYTDVFRSGVLRRVSFHRDTHSENLSFDSHLAACLLQWGRGVCPCNLAP